MKITIFGADGRTGREVLEYALSQGHEVIAFAYRDTALASYAGRIKTIQGDVLNYDKVLEACRGTEAVISALGHIKDSDPRMQTKGIIHIVKAMKETGVSRIVSLTGTGVRRAGDTPSLIDRFLNVVIERIDPERIADGKEHARVLEASGLRWTIIRVLKLGNSSRVSTEYKLTLGGPAELQTSRKKVARIMVDVAVQNSYTGEMPVVSA